MKQFGCSPRRWTSACQNLPLDFEEKLFTFQGCVIKKRLEDYRMEQIWTANQAPVYLDMPAVFTGNDKGTKEVKLKPAGYEKQQPP